MTNTNQSLLTEGRPMKRSFRIRNKRAAAAGHVLVDGIGRVAREAPVAFYPTIEPWEIAERRELKYCESCGRLGTRATGSRSRYCEEHSYLEEKTPMRLASLLLSGKSSHGTAGPVADGPISLASAILKGQHLVRFIPGTLRPGRKKERYGNDGDCLAGACLAAGIEVRYESIKEIWPWTSAGVGLPCGCPGSNVLNVRLAIGHLFDVHVMVRKDLTLEQLVRWVEFVDPTTAGKDFLEQATVIPQCKNWKLYKGIRKPRCNNGNPCLFCLAKYSGASTERMIIARQALHDKYGMGPAQN